MATKKLIHILGGGTNQIPLIKAAQELGHKVLVTDMNTISPATAIADYYEAINITDKEASLDAAIKYKIDAITSDQSDVAVPTIAYISQKLKLPGITEKVAELFTNKKSMRDKLSTAVPESTPLYFYTESEKQAVSYIKELDKYPLIVKPIDNQGSKGVVKLDKGSTITDAVKTAFDYSKIGGILIEEFIQGVEYAVETVVQEHKIYPLAVSRKYHYRECDYLDQKVIFPSDLSRDNEAKLIELNSKIIKSLGLADGLTHAEYKLDTRGFYLMEIAARGAGSAVSSTIVPYLTGFNTNQYLISRCLAENYPMQIKDYHRRSAILEFIDINEIRANRQGLISQALILDRAREIAYQINLDQSKINLKVSNSNDRCGTIIVFSEHGERDVEDKMKEIKSNIQLQYE